MLNTRIIIKANLRFLETSGDHANVCIVVQVNQVKVLF